MERKVELLAPAGNYESFLGAMHAGADAVYLGGEKFGARAYARNFSKEELCRAIRYAHLFDKKVYLTLNTLVKESEFSQIYDYLKPYYEEGLDGIIVQDMGVFAYVRERFPNLPLHVSTQAFVTGAAGAGFLKEQGAARIVPARELSLKEIRQIKEQTGLELETFIHGAMCYCYSGQCLFSSIAGGRSGNRGRCAQPCRLPYQGKIEGKSCFEKESYPLSLKDMCTIEDLPALIEAGIDSFKIEGRMKKPEYAAGVTAIYRKYIDAYYENTAKNGHFVPKQWKVSNADMQKLSSLYIRSEIQNGYYFRQNGKEMITLQSPSYSESDEKLLQDIRKKFLIPEKKKGISLYLYCHVGEPLMLTLSCEKENVTVTGAVVERASNQPVEAEVLKQRISRFGNTLFAVEACQVDAEADCFVPLKALNELRREGCEQLEDAILKQNNDTLKNDEKEKPLPSGKPVTGWSVLIATEEQRKACLTCASDIKRIYMDSDLFLQTGRKELPESSEVYLALPFVLRMRDKKFLERLKQEALHGNIDGFLVRNLEELGWLKKELPFCPVVFDAGMYSFNKKALEFYQSMGEMICLPYELNGREKQKLLESTRDEAGQFEQVIYGRIPMMIAANCLNQTADYCDKKEKNMTITDRYHHEFPVQNVCSHCYNIIWNCLPLSLHARQEKYADCLRRLQFTTEGFEETKQILQWFTKKDHAEGFPVQKYTTGHETRGVM